MTGQDRYKIIQQQIENAIELSSPLQVVGGNSKLFYGREPQGLPLNLAEHVGIINYHPSELVITARAGTRLEYINQVLHEQGQMLAFEPPVFSSSSTLGGAIASGLSGPRRAFTGSARDFVLGTKIINGKAEVLSFGGEVMKNVAGYDVSRLMVGAMGTLGVMLEISLKVLPQPESEKTRVFTCSAEQALQQMIHLSRQSLPLSGLCFDGQQLFVRLSGMEKSVQASGKKLGGEEYANDTDFWEAYVQHEHAFFQSNENLWRLSVPPDSPKLALSGDWFYDWGGALRWLKSNEDCEKVFAAAEALQGHATLFRSQDQRVDIFQPLPKPLQKINHNIKKAFDPYAIFNPYRVSKDW